MPKVSREEIEEKLLDLIEEIKQDKNIVKEIQDKMAEYSYLAGDVKGFIIDSQNEIPELDIRIICLLFEAIHDVTLNFEALPDHYFMESEIQTSRQYTGDLQREDRLVFPITIDNAYEVGKDIYSSVISAGLIKKLMDSLLLHYNFNTQREADKHIKKTGQVIYEPTVNKNNIIEMTEHLKNGTLLPNALIFNAGVKTNRQFGFEIEYNKETKQLTILQGTKVDIVDGYHRCKAIQNALELDPSIDFNFPVLVTNFTEKKAQTLLGQMSKAMPISDIRAKEFIAERFADNVVKELRVESELNKKISQIEHVNYNAGEIVSYNLLADTIHEVFPMKTKSDVIDVQRYLINFFDYLIGSFSKEFIDEVSETHKKSLINDNNMVGVGYIILAKKMQDEGLDFTEVKNILNRIDFSKENKMWEELDIYKDGKLTKDARKNIAMFFKEINLKEGVTNV